MNIESTLYLLSGVKLDNSYTNTILFTDSVSQYEYFSNKKIKEFTKIQYRRKSDNVINIACPVAEIENASYMMWQNMPYSNRWFYAFVTGVEYVSDDVTAVFFEIDYFQSYMLYFQYDMCFVEREHAMTDVPGDNVLDEPVGATNIVTDGIVKTGLFTEYSLVIWKADTGEGIQNDYLNGLYCGLSSAFSNLSSEGAKAITAEISKMVDDNELGALVSITAIPDAFYIGGGYNNNPVIKEFATERPYSLDGYTPRNKKLLTYPYCYLCVDSTQNVATYRYERFKNVVDSMLHFNIAGMCVYPSPEIVLSPNNYEVSGDDVYTQRLTMSGFPTFASSADSYKAYLAQSGLPVIPGKAIGSFVESATGYRPNVPDVSVKDILPIGQGTLKGVAGGMVSGAMTGGVAGSAIGGAVGGIAGAFGGSSSSIMNVAEKANMPDQIATGAGGTLTSALATRNLDFYFKKMSITAQEARCLDDFFDMFGYQTNRLKKPNINGRTNWNYVKTRYCNITGNIPIGARNAIINATNRGITFWKNGEEIGNYNLSNTII